MYLFCWDETHLTNEGSGSSASDTLQCPCSSWKASSSRKLSSHISGVSLENPFFGAGMSKSKLILMSIST